MLPDERMVEAACSAVVANARKRGWRGNDKEAWSLRSDATVAARTAFAALDREALIEAGAQAAPTYGPGRIGRYAPQRRREMAEAVLRAVGLIS